MQDDCSDQTIRRIHEEATANLQQHLYLVFDPSIGKALPISVQEDVQPIQIRLKHPDIPDDREPRLLEIPLLTSREFLLHETVEMSMQEVFAESRSGRKARSICAWILSENSAHELAAAIASFAWQKIDHQRRLVRCWDPRVLLALPDICGLKGMPLKGVTGTCFFLDWQGALVRQEITASSQGEANWRLDRLLNLGLHNRLMQLSALLAGRSWQETSRSIWQAIDLSQDFGASLEDDQYRLARDLTQHSIFIQHSPRFLSIIASMNEHPGSYGALTSELDADDWALMLNESKAIRAPHNA
jgi:hypothetical protein